jgi:DNA-binding NtrC family response regulator
MPDRPLRVLIVEDQLLIALDLEIILESYGYEVVGPVASVSVASRIIAHERIDAALVDFVLNDGEASPLVEVLTAHSIPFALCTGSHASEMSARYPHAPVLSKPFRSEDVRDVVAKLMASKPVNV